MATKRPRRRATKNGDPQSNGQQTTAAPANPSEERLDLSSLETWLWDAACAIRGATDAPKFKDYILPLIFFKRLSDVFDDELAEKVHLFGDETVAREIIEADHADALASGRPPIVRFYVPSAYNWQAVRNHPADGRLAPQNAHSLPLGRSLFTSMREFSILYSSISHP